VLLESIVRKTLGVNDHKVTKITWEDGGLIVKMERMKRHKLPCNQCRKRSWVYDTLKERRWRHVPLWGIPVTIHYAPRRVDCSDCGIKVERIPWGPSKSPISLPFIILLATMSKQLAIDVVAKLYGLAWATVASAVKQAVDYGLEHQNTRNVVYIGIDEISRKKGHVYHTQVYDLVKKRLLWSGEGRDRDTLRRFFQWWGEKRSSRLAAICCDMWAPYVDVIKECAPDAVLVFDKFHIVSHLTKAVDEVRKREVERLSKTNPDLLKGTKYIWLKNPWNLTPHQKQRLGYLEKLNLKVNRAYLLKEAFRRYWDYSTKGWAKNFLKKWFWWATHSKLTPMRDFAWFLRRHEENILTYIDIPIDNGAVEAMNNNAKALSHRARGFRTEKWFSTVMLHGMGQLPMPEYAHKFL